MQSQKWQNDLCSFPRQTIQYHNNPSLCPNLEKAMATHSSTLTWKIPWTEEPGRLQSMGSLRVRHDWVTSLSLSLSCIGEGNSNPLQCSCLENPRDGGAWWAAIYGVTQSRTRLKRLSSSSSMPQPVMLKKLKLNSSMKTFKTSWTNTQKRCPFHYRGLESNPI